jgi:hypothetical protein
VGAIIVFQHCNKCWYWAGVAEHSALDLVATRRIMVLGDSGDAMKTLLCDASLAYRVSCCIAALYCSLRFLKVLKNYRKLQVDISPRSVK